MIKCTRKIEFDVAHRVIGHENKCKYIHGHRYVLEITASAKNLNKLGMVVDFGLLKEVVKTWIDNNFDHTIILSREDKLLGDYIAKHTGQSVYYLNNNPTAENIALHLRDDIIPILFTDNSFKISSVKLWETPNCYVEVLNEL